MIREDLEPYVKLMGGEMRYDAGGMCWYVSKRLENNRYATVAIADDERLDIALMTLAELASTN